MTHTSGLGGLVRNRELRRTRQPLQRWLDALYQTTLEAPPGTRVHYTSAGAALLGDVVCRVSGMELRDFLAREFFRPLGMRDSFHGRRDEDSSRICPQPAADPGTGRRAELEQRLPSSLGNVLGRAVHYCH